jgi:hypothetical protein
VELPPERSGPYLRALSAGLRALAPHGDFVPLAECLTLLDVLHPEVSGDVLEPGRVDPSSGLPGFAWIARARSEQQLARQGDDRTDMDDAAIQRALRLDPRLGQRLQARRRLHRRLRRDSILPASRLITAVHRLSPTIDVTLTSDRLAPDGRWVRTRCTASYYSRHILGPIHLLDEGGAEVDEGVVHLFGRHAHIPLLALREQLAAGLGGRIVRLSRSSVGPFWFPGVPLPEEAPAALGRGLVLALSTEVVAEDVHQSRHLDPLMPDQTEQAPPDAGLFRQRRFAATPAQVVAIRDWGRALDMDLQVVPFGR